MLRPAIVVSLIAACCVAVACANQMRNAANEPSAQASADPAAAAAVAAFPAGPAGALIAYGHEIIVNTPAVMGANVTAKMSCAACHPNGGRVPHQGSFLGLYAEYPQWNKRAHRFIALQDRVAECFLYSMNGRPPAYDSKEMIAIVAYISFLSRGAKVGEGFAGQKPLALSAGPPNIQNGARIYAARCLACHGANGNGSSMAQDPPLWGPNSFNDKAGMSHLDRMAPFVRAAMPQNAPGTLTDQEATDVAAFVLTHPRPRFDKSKLIEFPARPAAYF
jgi:thiosulfate dehydrogenase